jgi:hypothetical protein
LSRTIQYDDLVPEEERFRDDGSGSAGATQANCSSDEMKEQAEDIAHYRSIVADSGSMTRL